MFSYVREIEDKIYIKYRDQKTNKPKIKKTDMQPIAYFEGNGRYKSFISNQSLDRVKFSSIKEFNEEVKNHKGMMNDYTYGIVKQDYPILQYLYDNKHGEDKRYDDLDIYFYDIEVVSKLKDEALDTKNTKVPLTTFTMIDRKTHNAITWSLRYESLDDSQQFNMFEMFIDEYKQYNEYDDFAEVRDEIQSNIKKFKSKLNTDNKRTINKMKKKISDCNTELKFLDFCENIDFREYDDEEDMLLDIISYFEDNNIDMLGGFNSKAYDDPYTIRRMLSLLGEDETQRLSPFDKLKKIKNKDLYGNKYESYDIVGLGLFDYSILYRNYTFNERDSWTLDSICADELGARKKTLTGGFWNSYHNEYQKFVAYNIIDVDLLYHLDKKKNFLNTALNVVHIANCQFKDFQYSTKTWENKIWLRLKEKDYNFITPKITKNEKGHIEGAYNKEIAPRVYKNGTAYDLKSLYPHLIMQYNISPETYVPLSAIKDEKLIKMSKLASKTIHSGNPNPHSYGVDLIIDKDPRLDFDYIKSKGLIMTPNGAFFRRGVKGLGPTLMHETYNGRKTIQKSMRTHYKEANETNDKVLKAELLRIANIENLDQHNKKIDLNSYYGVFLQSGFPYYNQIIGSAITSAGQLSIRYIAKYLNTYINAMLNLNKDYIIGSSTDSIYVSLDSIVNTMFKPKFNTDDVIESNKEFVDFIDNFSKTKIEAYDDLADYVCAFENKMAMSREVIFRRGFWQNKRVYLIEVLSDENVYFYKKPKYKLMGHVSKKAQTPKIMKNIMQY